jgi:hypothetical protein
MKTTLQELIEKWELEKSYYIPNALIFQAFIDDAKKMLEKEKKQIMDAYMEGGDWESLPQPRFDNYYNQTFNTNEK